MMTNTSILLLLVSLTYVTSQGKSYVGTGSYVYTDTTGKTIHVTYVEDDNGIKITSQNVTPEQEKLIIEQIKNQNSQLSHPQFQQQFNQFPNAFNYAPIYPWYNYAFPNFQNYQPYFNNFPSFPNYPNYQNYYQFPNQYANPYRFY